MRSFAAFAVLALTMVARPVAQSADAAALTALIERLVQAQANYDPITLDTLLTPDYVEVSPVGEVDPRDKVLGFYKPESKPPSSQVTTQTTVSEVSARVQGDTAIVIARLTFSVTANGVAQTPRHMRATFVCRKTGNTWKIASAQYTGIRATLPEATEWGAASPTCSDRGSARR